MGYQFFMKKREVYQDFFNILFPDDISVYDGFGQLFS